MPFQWGKEQEVRVGNKKWRLGRLELGVIEKFRDWIKEQIGDPFEDLDRFIDKLPPERASEMLAEARAIKQNLKCFSLQSQLAQEWLATELGAANFALFMLQVNHPEAELSDAMALAQVLSDQAVKEKGQEPAGNEKLPAA